DTSSTTNKDSSQVSSGNTPSLTSNDSSQASLSDTSSTTNKDSSQASSGNVSNVASKDSNQSDISNALTDSSKNSLNSSSQNSDEKNLSNIYIVDNKKNVSSPINDGTLYDNKIDQTPGNKDNVSLSSDAVSGFNDGLNGTYNSSNKNSDYSYAYSYAAKRKEIIQAAASKAYTNQVEGVNSYTSEEQSYYDATSNGVNDARQKYNDATNSLGTDDSYESYKPSNADQLKSSASLANSSTKSYEDSLTSKYNNSNNTSVRLAKNQKIVIPNSNDIQNSNYMSDSYINMAYRYGVNYFLSHQGANDAETGKWKGTSSNNGGSMQDNYKPSNDTSNPYDSAYLGANDAINNQWTINSSGTVTGYNNVSTISSKNKGLYYSYGYNDVSNQVQNGTIFVSDAYQFNYAFTQKGVRPGRSISGAVNSGTVINGLKNIKLTNDISFSNDNDLNQFVNWKLNDNSSSVNISVDGQNHIADFHSVIYWNNTSKASDNLNVKNFRTVYANNWFGFISLGQQGSMHFSNINYIGTQFLSSQKASAYLDGSINSFNVSQYVSPLDGGKIHKTPTGRQENIEAKDVILQANANFFGVTDKAGSGTTVYISGGNLTLGNNSSMTLIPRGNTGGSYGNYPHNYGVVLYTNGSMNVNENANLNIVPDTTSFGNSNRIASGIALYNGSSAKIRGNVNVLMNGDVYNDTCPVYNIGGTIQIGNGGTLNVKLSNLQNYINNYGIVYNENGRINAYDGGSLLVSADGSNKMTLIYNDSFSSNSFLFNNPGKVILDLTKNTNYDSKIIQGYLPQISAYSTNYRISPNDSLSSDLYQLNYLSGSHLNTTDFKGNISSNTIPSNYLELSNVPTPVFVGPISITDNSNGDKNIVFYTKINNYDSNSKNKLYVQYATGSNDTDYSSLKAYPGSVTNDENGKLDSNYYNLSIDLSNYNKDKLTRVSFTIPKGWSNNINDVGVMLRYGVSGQYLIQNIDDDFKGVDSYGNEEYFPYSRSAQNINKNSNTNQLYLDSTINTDSGYSNFNSQGVNDALKDGYYSNTNARNEALYQRNLDYTHSYDDAKTGYNKYLDNPNDDYNNIDSDINSNIENPFAYIQGINQAVSDRNKTINSAQDDAKVPAYNEKQYNGRIHEVYVRAYNDAVISYASNRAFSDFESNNSKQGESLYSNNVVASSAYSSAYVQASSAYDTAISNFKSNTSTSGEMSSIASSAYNTAYSALNNAKDDVSSGFSMSSSHGLSNINSIAYSNAYQELFNASSAGINDYNNLNNTTLSSSYSADNSQANIIYKNAYSTVSSAASQARKDFEAGSAANGPKTPASAAKAYSDAYAAVSTAKQDYDKGSSVAYSDYTAANSSAYASEYAAFSNAASQAQSDYDGTKGSNSAYSSNAVANGVYSNAYSNVSSAADQARKDFQGSGKASDHGYTGS
ncbi:hypothetical protein M2S00_07360, partial [Apilactobacillus sp. TMW 2.2459]|uniref:hypothetical protein n=1 Tax=Apilactobacillus xinyiensis TaxID=2841032 RepID=UPI00200DAA06